jgi:hypothetical protein
MVHLEEDTEVKTEFNFFYHNLPCPPSYDEVFHINILVRKPAVKE